jgi:glucose dehydrogenase
VGILKKARLKKGSFNAWTLIAAASGVVMLMAAATPTASAAAPAAHGAGQVDEARMKAAPTEPDNWVTSGRDQDGTYYSPLTRINDKNVGGLGFAWDYDLGTHRGQEATPIVVDGVMYTSGTWGYVYAVDARTGKDTWRPEIPAATWSTGVLPSGRVVCTWLRSTAVCMRWMRRRVRKSGKSTP